MSLQDTLKKIKEKRNLLPLDWELLARTVAEKVIGEKMSLMEDELIKEAHQEIKELAKTLTPTLKGDKGDTGEKGDIGDTGKTGLAGKDGRAGLDGLDGRDGAEGNVGKDGKEGSPDTPEQIANKLNLLEEKVDQTVIKGLKTTLLNLHRSIKEAKQQKVGGGGMGNISVFSFIGDGTTTTFTLSSEVAAGGRAIWAYYNGQGIFLTTHFTISGRVLTTTFIAQADTLLEGLFIRT